MIENILTSPAIYNITQATQAQVGIEIGLKAIGRPGFILLDKTIDQNTKKYSATKEFLYQLTCFVASIAVIIPVFKKGSFKIAKKLYKNEPIFKVFKNSDMFNEFYKKNQSDRIQKLREIYGEVSKRYSNEELQNHIDLAKGMIETTSIAGSVLGLSVLSPMISRPFIQPILKRINKNKNADNKINLKA